MASNIPPTLKAHAIKTAALKHYGQNPRRGDVDVIADSLTRHGQYKPIVVRSSTLEVLAGNHTLAAARQLEWEEIAATFVDVDDAAAARIVLADNRTADLAGYDNDELVALLASLPNDLAGTGYTLDDLEALATGGKASGSGDPDEGEPAATAYAVMVECADEGEQELVYNRLLERGLELKAVAM